MASGRADTDNFQYSDADFRNNLNDNYINQVISANLKNCVYTDFLNFDSRVDVFHSLFMLHFNIRSLQKNFETFYESLQLLPTLPQIIGISETKINDTPLTNISIPNYMFLHANSTTRAGGVGLYILSSISFKLLGKNQLSNVGCENLWVSLNFPGVQRTVVIAIIYRHPRSDSNAFIETLNNKLGEIDCNKNDFYLMGDINLNISESDCSSSSINYLSMLESNGVFQLITKPTRVTKNSASLIDHIFTSALSNPIFPGIILNDISDHFITYCATSLKRNPESVKHKKYFCRDIKNLNIESYLLDLDKNMKEFKNCLNCINANNFNSIFDDFIKRVRLIIDFYAPLRQISRRQKRLRAKPWLTKGLLVSIKYKQKLYRSHFLSNDVDKKTYYKQYSNKLNKIKTKAKKTFYYNLFKNNCKNPCKTWSTINSVLHTKDDTKSTPYKLNINNRTIIDPTVISNCFYNYFSEVGRSVVSNLSNCSATCVKDFLINRVTSTIFLEPASINEILNIINELNINKAAGYDDISCYFIKLSSTVLTPVLSTLVNSAMTLGIFPEKLKLSKVIPLFKKGDPISILTCFTKIFEKVIFNRLLNFFNKHSVLVSNQYGFRENCSTSHAILDIVTSTYDNINNNQYTGMVTLDITKAFDTVCHKRLLIKLDHYGIRGTAFNLIQSYLNNRLQYVHVNNNESN